ncbi:MAG: hypothetical protein ACYCY3_11635 [Halothiobacillus sp.]
MTILVALLATVGLGSGLGSAFAGVALLAIYEFPGGMFLDMP